MTYQFFPGVLRTMIEQSSPENQGPSFFQTPVRVGLFAALITLGSYLSVPLPLSPVPVSLQTLFVMLAGMFLGPKKGMAATAFYVLLGLVGLPVFAQGASGLGRLLGPTGGYLLGFILSAGVSCGVFLLFRRFEATPNLLRLGALVAGLAGTLAVYAVGAPWLRAVNNLSWESAVAFGIVPFLVGDLLKILVLGFVAPRGLALFRTWD